MPSPTQNKEFILSLHGLLIGQLKEFRVEGIPPSEQQTIKSLEVKYEKDGRVNIECEIECDIKVNDIHQRLFYNLDFYANGATLEYILKDDAQTRVITLCVAPSGVMSTANRAGLQAGLLSTEKSQQMLSVISNMLKQVLPDMLRDVINKRLSDQSDMLRDVINKGLNKHGISSSQITSPDILEKEDPISDVDDLQQKHPIPAPLPKNLEKQEILPVPNVANSTSVIAEKEPEVECYVARPSKPMMSEKEQNEALLAFKKKFEDAVLLLKNKKVDQFSGDPKVKKEAYDKAQALCLALDDLAKNYWQNPSEEALTVFKKDSMLQLEDARITLDKHRGVAKIVLSILAIIGTLGIYGIVAVADRVSSGRWSFFATDSSLKTNVIADSFLSPKNG